MEKLMLGLAVIEHGLSLMKAALDEAAAEQEPEAESTECTHPPEARQDIAAMGNADAWRCGLCGYMHTNQEG